MVEYRDEDLEADEHKHTYVLVHLQINDIRSWGPGAKPPGKNFDKNGVLLIPKNKHGGVHVLMNTVSVQCNRPISNF